MRTFLSPLALSRPHGDRFWEEINDFQNPEQVLAYLSCHFNRFKKIFLKNQFLKEEFVQDLIKNSETISHKKKALLEESTAWGTLRLELLVFTGKKYTGPHTHPEFVLDEILNGELIEKELCGEGNSLEVKRDHYRKTGDWVQSFDPQGRPHNVTAINGPCLSLCLNLGKNPVSFISGKGL